MKQILKTVFIVVFLSVALATTAQEGKFYFGAKAGFSFSDLSKYPFNSDMKHAFTGGLTFDYFLKDNLYLSSAIEYVNKGVKYDRVDPYWGGTLTSKESTVAAYYIQVPVHVGYKFDLNKDVRLMVQAGPYVAYGVGGQKEFGDEVTITTAEGVSSTMTLNEFFAADPSYWRRGEETFSDSHFREFDWGIGAGLSVEYQHINVGFRYDFGLYNISRMDEKIKNRSMYITLGYKF